MPGAFLQQVENGLAANANAAAVSITTLAHSTVIVVSSQHPSSVATITDTLGETWITGPGGGIFSSGLFAYVCQDSKGGANTITTHSNSTNLAAVYASEIGGLQRTGGILGSAVLGQNGPGAGTDAVTAGTFAITAPAFLFGFVSDFQASGNVITPGTGFAGRASVWGGNTGGAHAFAEDRRILTGGSFGSTFTASTGSADIYVSLGIALAEIVGLPVCAIGVVSTIG